MTLTDLRFWRAYYRFAISRWVAKVLKRGCQLLSVVLHGPWSKH
jgi:hypothetical protein